MSNQRDGTKESTNRDPSNFPAFDSGRWSVSFVTCPGVLSAGFAPVFSGLISDVHVHPIIVLIKLATSKRRFRSSGAPPLPFISSLDSGLNLLAGCAGRSYPVFIPIRARLVYRSPPRAGVIGYGQLRAISFVTLARFFEN